MNASEVRKLIESEESLYGKNLNIIQRDRQSTIEKIRAAQEALENAYNVFSAVQRVENPSDHGMQVRNILKEAEKKRNDISGEITTLTDDIQKAGTSLKELYVELETIDADLWSALEADAVYMSARDDYITVSKKCDEKITYLNALRDELLNKFPGYLNNRVFVYLNDRNVGEKNQAGNILTGRLDRMLARASGYYENKSNFFLIKNTLDEVIPEKLEKEKTEIDEFGTRVALIEKRVFENQVRLKIKSSISNMEQFITDKRRSLEKLIKDQQDISTGKDELTNWANNLILVNVKKSSTSDLKRMSERTVSVEDDEVISIITEKTKELTSLFAMEEMLNKEISSETKKHENALKLKKIFKSNSLDSSSYRYKNEEKIQDVIGSFILGASTSDAFIKVLTNNREYINQDSYSSGSYSSSRDDDDWGFSGSSKSSSGGFSSSGSFGSSGGFSTSDDF